MDKLLFKNKVLNLVIGIVLLIFTIVAYSLGWFTEFLSIIIGLLLIVFSLKRFWFSFQKATNKYATVVLIAEILLDILFGAIVIYKYENVNVQIYAGAIVYIRGLSYLLINHIATRDTKFGQFSLNIGYITLGSFLIFTSFDIFPILKYTTIGLITLVGLVYLIYAISQFKDDKNTAKPKATKPNTNKSPHKSTSVLKETPPTEKKPISDPILSEVEAEAKSKPKQNTMNYQYKTVAELKDIARDRGLSGYSQLNKSELIEFLRNH